MSAAEMTWPAVTATPLCFSVPAVGSVVILTAASAVRRRVVRVAEAEVGGRERVGGVLCVVTVLSAPAGASFTDVTLTVIVLARLIEVDAAVGGAAVVLHLEGEAGVAGCRWRSPPA